MNLKTLVFEPKRFFQERMGFAESWLFYFKVFLVCELIRIVIDIPLYLQDQVGQTAAFWIGLVLGLLVFVAVFPTMHAFFAHLGVLMVGGKKGFERTFQSVSASFAIGALYVTGAELIAAPLQYLFPGNDSVLLLSGIIAMLILFVGFIHLLYVEVIGVAVQQKISPVQSFIGAVVVPAVIELVIAGIILFVGVVIWAAVTAL